MASSNDRKTAVNSFPWWLTVLAAIATYSGLKYILPQIKSQNEFITTLAEIGPTIAPILTIGLLLLAAKQLYDKDLPGSDNQAEDSCEDDALSSTGNTGSTSDETK